MSYYEKLKTLLGREPLKEGLQAHIKYHPYLKTVEDAAKDLFEYEINFLKGQKAKAKKLGLI